ncbi:MAG TPA: arylesterase [Azospira sp.]|nr:arylesterase [Azospira sp.]
MMPRLFLIVFALLLPPLALGGTNKTILVFGDSLSAGYGIRQDAAWPALLASRLKERRLDYSVVNASISGETSAGGRARISEALGKHHPSILILALGANDGLRGLPIKQMQDNLGAIATAARQQGAKILLVGMRLPPNFGPYAQTFHHSFTDLARQQRLALVDFLLDGIAERPELFQADGLHPVAEAQPQVLENVWKGLSPLLK